jgi:hypothetical protein
MLPRPTTRPTDSHNANGVLLDDTAREHGVVLYYTSFALNILS